MREVIVRGLFRNHTVRLMDSIKELPINRYNDLQKMILQDLGIGTDLNSIAQHFSLLHTYLSNQKVAEAMQEAQNLHNNFYYIIQGLNIKSYCFACLVVSIDGQSVTDYTEDGLKKTIRRLTDIRLKEKHVADTLEAVKKNLIQNFNPSFLIGSTTAQQLTFIQKSSGEPKPALGRFLQSLMMRLMR